MILLAGFLLIATGLLHASAGLIDNWSPETLRLVPVGIVYAALGLAVLRGRRWSMVVAVFLVLLGAAALFMITYHTDVPRWMTLTMIAADLLIAVTLGLVLSWREVSDDEETGDS